MEGKLTELPLMRVYEYIKTKTGKKFIIFPVESVEKTKSL